MNPSAERNPLFVSLIERATETLHQACELREQAEVLANNLVGTSPQPSSQGTTKPAEITVVERVGMLIDQIHGAIAATRADVARVLRELPPIPERHPPPSIVGGR